MHVFYRWFPATDVDATNRSSESRSAELQSVEAVVTIVAIGIVARRPIGPAFVAKLAMVPTSAFSLDLPDPLGRSKFSQHSLSGAVVFRFGIGTTQASGPLRM